MIRRIFERNYLSIFESPTLKVILRKGNFSFKQIKDPKMINTNTSNHSHEIIDEIKNELLSVSKSIYS
jgi:hypothetical protein